MSKLFDRNIKAGFTLVELIVVIAILALLAGVAIPVYSNYVTKANQAADEQLLAAVNTAAAAAVLEARGTDMAKLADGALTATINPVVITDASEPNVTTAFARYFAGNEGSSFKVIKSLVFKDGVFQEEESLSVTINGKTYTYAQSQVDAYKNSNYNKVQPIELTNSVDSLATALGDNKGGLAALANTANFKAELVKLGIIDDADAEITAAMLTSDPALAKEIANASVLYVAEVASTMDPDQVYTAFVNGDIDNLVDGSGVDATFVTAALQYGLLTAFVNTEDGAAYKTNFQADSQNVKGLKDVADLFKKYTNDKGTGTYYDYATYLKSDAAATDIKGFLSALSIINDNATNFDLSSVYSDGDVIAAVNAILGNNP